MDNIIQNESFVVKTLNVGPWIVIKIYDLLGNLVKRLEIHRGAFN